MIETSATQNHQEHMAQHPSDILGRLFAYFEAQAIPYCVLGPADALEADQPGDIDLVVNDQAFKEMGATLTAFCDRWHLSLVQMIHHEPTACFYVLSWLDETRQLHFLHLDICTDYFQHGKYLLDAETMLSGRSLYRSKSRPDMVFYIPAPRKALIYYLLKKIAKQTVDPSHQQALTHWFEQDTAGASEEIRRFWPEPHASQLIWILQHHTWDDLKPQLPQLKQTIQYNLARTLRAQPAEWLRCLLRWWVPTGLWIAVIGPDGCGKSSVIREISRQLAPAFRQVDFQYLRPRLWLSPATLNPPATNPHAIPPRNPVVSLGKLLYFWFDYTLGYLFKLRPMRVFSTLVIFDRYYYDLMVDPLRFRYSGPLWLARWMCPFIPHPECIILLDAPPEVLQSRKQEVPFEETARQQQAYQHVISRQAGGTVIDAGQPLEQVVSAVNQVVLTYLANRIQHRV